MPPKSQLQPSEKEDVPGAGMAGQGLSFGSTGAIDFESLDLDGDGILTREEFEKAMQMQAALAASGDAANDTSTDEPKVAPASSSAPATQPAQNPSQAKPQGTPAAASLTTKAPTPTLTPTPAQTPSAASTAKPADPEVSIPETKPALGDAATPVAAAPATESTATKAAKESVSASAKAGPLAAPSSSLSAATAAASSPDSSLSFSKKAEIELPTLSMPTTSMAAAAAAAAATDASSSSSSSEALPQAGMAGTESYGDSASSSASLRGKRDARSNVQESGSAARIQARSESEALLPGMPAWEDESSASRVQRIRNMAFGGVGTAICAIGIFALQLWVAWDRYDCRLPADIANVSPDGPCLSPEDDLLYKEGSIPGGAVCRPMCAEGYEADPDTSLRCLKGVLSPPSFRCEPKSCAVPTNVEHADPRGFCEEGLRIASGSNCTTQCRGSYVRSIESLLCDKGKLIPDDIPFRCTKLACPLPSHDDIPHSAPGLCRVTQSDSNTNFQACTPLCEEGFQSTVDEMVCNEETGSIEPTTFECVPASCTLPTGVKHSVEPVSKTIDHGQSYSPSCGDGYMVENRMPLRCAHGRLHPAKFKCTTDMCEVPAEVEHVAEDGPCQDSSIIRFVRGGRTCDTRCEDGYIPTISKLLCSKGNLDPPSFACERADLACSLPQSIENANPEGGCLSGHGFTNTIVSGKSCQAQCEEGYDPEPHTLACQDGAFEQHDGFQCRPRACMAAVLKVEHADEKNPCKLLDPDDDEADGGSDSKVDRESADGSILNGRSCAPQCDEGYTPSEEYLNCSHGDFFPSTFECLWLSCPVDTDTMRSIVGVAEEGPCADTGTNPIEPMSKCRAQCSGDLVAEPAELHCQGGQLDTPSFACLSSPCKVPDSVTNGGKEICRGIKSGTRFIGNGVECIPQCEEGYLPDLDTMTCKDGEWDHPVFKCLPKACKAEASGIACGEGDEIESGSVCSPMCIAGLEPSIEGQTLCLAGKFVPEVSCLPPSCSFEKLVSIEHISPEGICWDSEEGIMLKDRLPSNRWCCPKCEAGFGPNIHTMHCNAGKLMPPTFQCFASCHEPYEGACEEGPLIRHNSRCTPRCKPDEVASCASLHCIEGKLDPPNFECKKAHRCKGLDPAQTAEADETGRVNAKSCFRDWHPHDGFCQTKCKRGYVPSIDWLHCVDGTLEGADEFRCKIDKCLLPYIEEGFYVGKNCYVNGWINEGSHCELSCQTTGLTQLILCTKGELAPLNIGCRPFYGPWLPSSTTTMTTTITLTSTKRTADDPLVDPNTEEEQDHISGTSDGEHEEVNNHEEKVEEEDNDDKDEAKHSDQGNEKEADKEKNPDKGKDKYMDKKKDGVTNNDKTDNKKDTENSNKEIVEDKGTEKHMQNEEDKQKQDEEEKNEEEEKKRTDNDKHKHTEKEQEEKENKDNTHDKQEDKAQDREDAEGHQDNEQNGGNEDKETKEDKEDKGKAEDDLSDDGVRLTTRRQLEKRP